MDQSTASQASTIDHTTPGERPTQFRWVICGLLFFATTINYADRSVLNVLAPTLQKTIGWSDKQYGYIGTAFTFAYAIGFVFMGRFIDAVGTRIGYAIALVFWTLAGASHALARTFMEFAFCRFLLGLGESGNFPAAIKTVAEWFPQRQRATATGIFNAGSNVGAILAPLLVPVVVIRFGWPAAFLITPILAAVWIVLWVTLYRQPAHHPLVNQAERDFINSDSAPVVPHKTVRWREILPHRQTWAIMVGKFLTDPIWWFYLFWSGKFISDRFHADIKHIGPPLIVIYVLADFGSIFGGWLSSALIRNGWSTNSARKLAMFGCALAVLPVIYAPVTNSMWVAVVLIGLAAAAHQGFSANIFTLASDMFPKRAVGSVVGLAGLCGGVGGMIIQFTSGKILEVTGSYLIMFVIAGSVYLLAVTCVHLLAPRLDVVNLEETESRGFPIEPS
ncbi:MAG: MFS transporter [Planctomycetota bacterium]|nr:MFS transporter [Planctomycetota bacterium]